MNYRSNDETVLPKVFEVFVLKVAKILCSRAEGSFNEGIFVEKIRRVFHKKGEGKKTKKGGKMKVNLVRVDDPQYQIDFIMKACSKRDEGEIKRFVNHLRTAMCQGDPKLKDKAMQKLIYEVCNELLEYKATSVTKSLLNKCSGLLQDFPYVNWEWNAEKKSNKINYAKL